MDYRLIFDNVTLVLDKSKLLFDKLSLDIAFKHLLLIKGPVGSGKSTLLKLLAGFYEPDSGAISLKANNEALSCKYTYIHSYSQLNFVTASIIDELSLMKISFDPNSEAYNFYTPYLSKDISKLSGGELKKLSIRMALDYISQKRNSENGTVNILLLDEPLNMLDDIEAENITKMIISASEATPIIVATHDEHFDKVADNIINL